MRAGWTGPALWAAALGGMLTGVACEDEAAPPPAPAMNDTLPGDALAPPPIASAPSERATPAPARAVPTADDMTLIPGERVGPISRGTNREALTQLYGEKAVRDTQVTLDDGTVEVATRIERGKDGGATVIWWDDTRQTVKEVRNFGKGWHTPQGVHLGMGLEELEKAIGSFKIMGFGWDAGGTLGFEGSKLEAYRNRLFIRVDPTAGDPSLVEPASGDRLYDSGEPEMRRAKPVIREIIVSLDAAEGAE